MTPIIAILILATPSMIIGSHYGVEYGCAIFTFGLFLAVLAVFIKEGR